MLAAPFDYVVDPATVLQPDLLVARRADVGPTSLDRAAALLVIEILSPSTRLTDLGTKRLADQRGGVPWMIDTEEPRLTVFRLEDGVYFEESSTVGAAVYRTESPFAVEIVPARLAPPAPEHPPEP